MIPKSSEQSVSLFIVEDKEEVAESLAGVILKAVPNVRITVNSFENGLAQIESCDVLILDLVDELRSDQNAGERIWNSIWERKLIPIIVYSAFDLELSPPFPEDNPFIKYIKKGSDSEKQVADILSAIIPYILDLRNVRKDVEKELDVVLRKIAPILWSAAGTVAPEDLSRLLIRSARRRLAAMMDMKSATSGSINSWEQYLFPPVETDCILTGDLLRTKAGAADDATSYRVVLSPSCDIQRKVRELLVCKCAKVSEFLRKASLPTNNDSKLKERLPERLNEAQSSGFVVLPPFGNFLPVMAANLRELQLIAIDEVGLQASDEKPYLRIASLDSPFRERIAWAYLQIAGRPGLPNMNHDHCVEEIVRKKQS